MSVLSDHDILARLGLRSSRRLVVDPLGNDAVRPASVDIRLGDRLLTRARGQVVDPVRGSGPQWRECVPDAPGVWVLMPGELYLGVTLERVDIPNDLLCLLHGRSSLAREGIVIHQTAGLVDPGFNGRLTLEITVTHATVLRAGMPIGQLTFQTLTLPAERPYDGRYQHDSSPTPSRLALAVESDARTERIGQAS